MLAKIEFPPASSILPWVFACMATMRKPRAEWARHLGRISFNRASCSDNACALRSPPVALCPAGKPPSVPRRCSSHTRATVVSSGDWRWRVNVVELWSSYGPTHRASACASATYVRTQQSVRVSCRAREPRPEVGLGADVRRCAERGAAPLLAGGAHTPYK